MSLRSWIKWGLFVGVFGLLILAVFLFAQDEMQTSRLQARYLPPLAQQMRFAVASGPSSAIRFPLSGPYDERLGYSSLPEFSDRLAARGFTVTAQVRDSTAMLSLEGLGLYLPYNEKDQTGLTILDTAGATLYAQHFPTRVYAHFDDVPPLLVNSLLFIEDRDLLTTQYPHRNPAIDWNRFGLAAYDQLLHLLDKRHEAPGGSTLATQMEKFRHSPDGRTGNPLEKLRQIASASLRAYQDGPDTLPIRRQIVVQYLNTVPLSAKAGYGEVDGIGDGLWAWYGRDFDETNQLLTAPIMGEQDLSAQATVFKEALSLMIAQRAPSYYLREGRSELTRLTDSYLRLLGAAAIIPPALRDAALAVQLQLSERPMPQTEPGFVMRKAATAIRAHLSAALAVPRLYDLDRLDLVATSTLDKAVQETVSQKLASVTTADGAQAAGLYGFEMLNPGDDPSHIAFSFTLFERRGSANLLRVQTDSVNQPFDVNLGARLNLGSTAKLRTLISYLQIVSALHQRYAELDAAQLRTATIDPQDKLSRWALDYLSQTQDHGLQPMLEAALDRRYSASPGETFYTGGGAQTFSNFEPSFDHRILTVREAFQHSVNLVFVRLMRDIVHYTMLQVTGSTSQLLADPAKRADYLKRFADREGSVFLSRFYAKYHGKTPDEARALLLDSVRDVPAKVATALRSIDPDASPQRFAQEMKQALPDSALAPDDLDALYQKYGPDKFSLADRGYIASIHPLELWLVDYLRRHPDATLHQALDDSRDTRQEVYAWLFKTRRRFAQDHRIRGMIEREAFVEIGRQWRALGYPFESLTPSYAAAVGASGDRPVALAELMGIIGSGGWKLSNPSLTSLDFAANTPYETHFSYAPAAPERLLPDEIVQVVRRSLRDVVVGGTGRRLADGFPLSNGKRLEVYGKTGTGDQRFGVYARGGRLIESRKVNRTAAFVFTIGDRFFGVLTGYVHEPYAARYNFTSAMSVQLLKSLAPQLSPLLTAPAPTDTAPQLSDDGSATAEPESTVRLPQ
ncbi:transglycosylase domain-containing protein [Neisseriaceae bacterium JH1-16]|nr:transglycosylase domain-containing protein [Neisseriaceae bacterium JH1-16]